MKPLNKNVFVKKVVPEYTGMIVGVSTEETTQGRVLAIGPKVTAVNLNDRVLLDWKTATLVNGDLYLVSEDNIVGIIEDE